ncbi:MAG TPA: hypothetical protein PLJ56_03560 [Rectinema sp.]|nr:hypothetical protein [Rectinema sp.]
MLNFSPNNKQSLKKSLQQDNVQRFAILRSALPIGRIAIAILMCGGVLSSLPALGASLESSVGYTTEAINSFFIDETIDAYHTQDSLSIFWEIDVTTKRIYPVQYGGGNYGDLSVDIKNANVAYAIGPLSFYLGKMPVKDEIDSPYSLFLSGASPSLMTGGYRFTYHAFSFSDQWIGLDQNIQRGLYPTTLDGMYADRGMVLKTYAFNIGAFRLGYQDVILFTGNYFDIDLFGIVAPSILVQDILTSAAGMPGARSGNMNSVMGFFAEFKKGRVDAYAQLLIDDFNMQRFLHLWSYENPDKIAWSLGSKIDLSRGKLGLYFAGATRYAFESVSDEFYSYTIHAGSAINSGGEIVEIPIENQMLGYVHGENNIAFMVNWAGLISQLNTKTGIECVISGSKAPTNPWHNGEPWAELGTQLLNDPVLEIKLLLGLDLSYTWKRLTFFMRAKGGYVFNELNPVYSSADDSLKEPVFVPQAGDSRPIFELSIGALFDVDLGFY